MFGRTRSAGYTAFILLITYSIGYCSNQCEDGGEIIYDIGKMLFPIWDYDGINNENSLKEFGSSSSPCHYLYNTEDQLLFITGQECQYSFSIKIIYIVVPVRKISLKATGLETVERDMFLIWPETQYLEIVENTKLLKLSQGAFNGLDQLQTLAINNNFKLSILHPDTFKNLKKLTTLNLAGNNIYKLSDVTSILSLAAQPELSVLDLSRNPIKTLNYNELSLISRLSIESLILNDLDLLYVGKNAFSNLKGLKNLILGTLYPTIIPAEILNSIQKNNTLSYLEVKNMVTEKNERSLFKLITDASFRKVRLNQVYINNSKTDGTRRNEKLKAIEISESFFTEFPKIIFDYNLFPSLEEIILKTNKFDSLPNRIPQSRVKLLDLSGNNLISLTERYFYFAPELEILILRDASLISIEKKTFAHNKYLKFLDLSRNNFYELSHVFDKEIFYGLEKLNALNMSENKIARLKTDIFQYLHNLQYLSLRFNLIRTLDNELFRPMGCLKKLDLRNNLFTNIDTGLFNIKNFLKDIGLYTAIYKVDQQLIRKLNFRIATDYLLNDLKNCSNINIISGDSAVVAGNNCNVFINTVGQINEWNYTDVTTASVNTDADYNDSINTTINENEYFFVLFKPSYIYNTMWNSTWNLFRFLFVFGFYLLLFSLITVTIVKLMHFAVRYKRKKPQTLILPDEKMDFKGIENKAYNLP